VDARTGSTLDALLPTLLTDYAKEVATGLRTPPAYQPYTVPSIGLSTPPPYEVPSIGLSTPQALPPVTVP